MLLNGVETLRKICVYSPSFKSDPALTTYKENKINQTMTLSTLCMSSGQLSGWYV